jgi:hypothetical protein
MRFVALLLVLLCTAVAHATVLLPLDTEALTQRADRVLLGVVESQASHWTQDHQAIYTDVVVRVTRSYKGAVAVGERVTVRREGGSLDGVGMRVFGAAQFSVGEEVLLFMEKRGAASYTVGMTQGKLHVWVGADGQKQVAADLSSVDFLHPKNGKVMDAAAVRQAQAPRALRDVEAQIETLVRSGR